MDTETWEWEACSSWSVEHGSAIIVEYSSPEWFSSCAKSFPKGLTASGASVCSCMRLLLWATSLVNSLSTFRVSSTKPTRHGAQISHTGVIQAEKSAYLWAAMATICAHLRIADPGQIVGFGDEMLEHSASSSSDTGRIRAACYRTGNGEHGSSGWMQYSVINPREYSTAYLGSRKSGTHHAMPRNSCRSGLSGGRKHLLKVECSQVCNGVAAGSYRTPDIPGSV